MSEQTAPRAQGRLGRPDLTLAEDPRVRPALLAAMSAYGLDGPAVDGPVADASAADPAELLAVGRGLHEQFEQLFDLLPADPPHPGVEHRTETARGDDGQEVLLHVYRATGAGDSAEPDDGTAATRPGVLFLHGGGMAVLTAANGVYRRWCEDLALAGAVVVAPEFRNSQSEAGAHPFPAGLDDCATALEWLHRRREDLGVGAVVVQGESGGANLTLATALRARRDGRLDHLDGVYACVPFISGGYGWDRDRQLAELPSLVENDTYFLNNRINDLVAHLYDPGREHAEDPLCWPYHATADDVAGLPPHVITTDELDPLRDEGAAYARTLARAGVPVTARVNLGLVHAAEVVFGYALPDDRAAAVGDVVRFARSLSPDGQRG